jgi:hypothetical protein
MRRKGEIRGAGKGRPASIDTATVREMKAQGFEPTAITKALGRATPGKKALPKRSMA